MNLQEECADVLKTVDGPPTSAVPVDVDAEPALPPGSMLGAWRVVEPLGEGGMGRVYLAEHSGIGRRAAIKVLKRSLAHSSAVTRFFDEARAVNRIRHDGIVDVTDLFEVDGFPCIVMELLPGQTLAARLLEGPLPVDLAVGIALQIAAGLAAAHAASIVHRDLKPDNVMIVSTSPLRVKLLDFGVAKLGTGPSVQGITSAGALVGTPEYMAPEQLAGTPVDRRADIYALGLVIFEMLAGRRPFRGHSFGDWVIQHMTVAPPDLRDLAPIVPPTLASLVGQMLQKAPDDRPGLDAVLTGLRAATTPALPQGEAASTPSVRGPKRPVIVAFMVGMGVALSVVAWWAHHAADPTTTAAPAATAVPAPVPQAVPEALPAPPLTAPMPDPQVSPLVTPATSPVVTPIAAPTTVKPVKPKPLKPTQVTQEKGKKNAVVDPFAEGP